MISILCRHYRCGEGNTEVRSFILLRNSAPYVNLVLQLAFLPQATVLYLEEAAEILAHPADSVGAIALRNGPTIFGPAQNGTKTLRILP